MKRICFGFLIYFIILAGLGLELEDATPFCRLELVNSCTKDLDELGKQIAPFYDSEELDSLCRKWTADRPCLAHVTAACALEKKNETVTETNFEAIIARKRARQAADEWLLGYDYLCHDGRASYPVVQQCMSSDENLTALAEGCYQTYINNTWWLNTKEPSNIHRFCKAAREFFGCVKKEGREACGEDFTVWMMDYQERLWSPHLSDIECFMSTKVTRGELTMVSLCGATTAWCVIMTVCSWFWRPERKLEQKKKTQKKRTSNASLGNINRSFLQETENVSMDEKKRGDMDACNVETKSLEITEM